MISVVMIIYMNMYVRYCMSCGVEPCVSEAPGLCNLFIFLMQLSVGPGWGSALLIPNRASRHPPRLGGVTLFFLLT